MTSKQQAFVLTEKLNHHHGSIATITLNRPEALNALTTEMCRTIHTAVDEFVSMGVKAILFRARGRAFCAGGDIKVLYHNGPKGIDRSITHFHAEYELLQCIHDCPCPTIALLDGITMGGGAGLAMHTSFQVVSENMRFAMPECRIGLFPDVGASYFFQRIDPTVALYLALTGNSIDAASCYDIGLVSHYLPAAQHDGLCHRILATDFERQSLTSLLDQLNTPPQAHCPIQHSREIHHCFSAQSLAEVHNRCTHQSSSWADETRNTLEAISPHSAALTFPHIKRHFNDLHTALQADCSLVKQCLQHPDFYSGVRATLINRDKAPEWQ